MKLKKTLVLVSLTLAILLNQKKEPINEIKEPIKIEKDYVESNLNFENLKKKYKINQEKLENLTKFLISIKDNYFYNKVSPTLVDELINRLESFKSTEFIEYYEIEEVQKIYDEINAALEKISCQSARENENIYNIDSLTEYIVEKIQNNTIEVLNTKNDYNKTDTISLIYDTKFSILIKNYLEEFASEERIPELLCIAEKSAIVCVNKKDAEDEINTVLGQYTLGTYLVEIYKNNIDKSVEEDYYYQEETEDKKKEQKEKSLISTMEHEISHLFSDRCPCISNKLIRTEENPFNFLEEGSSENFVIEKNLETERDATYDTARFQIDLLNLLLLFEPNQEISQIDYDIKTNNFPRCFDTLKKYFKSEEEFYYTFMSLDLISDTGYQNIALDIYNKERITNGDFYFLQNQISSDTYLNLINIFYQILINQNEIQYFTETQNLKILSLIKQIGICETSNYDYENTDNIYIWPEGYYEKWHKIESEALSYFELKYGSDFLEKYKNYDLKDKNFNDLYFLTAEKQELLNKIKIRNPYPEYVYEKFEKNHQKGLERKRIISP